MEDTLAATPIVAGDLTDQSNNQEKVRIQTGSLNTPVAAY